MKFTPWIIALLITLCAGSWAAYADSALADLEDAAALSSREFAGQAMCGLRATPVWADDKTLECFKELP